jgi:F0F1-type ATP synthase assembly protein I
MVIFARISGYIAVPIILALYIGKYLDTKYHTDPYIFLGCIAVAFLTSIGMIAREMKKYAKDNTNNN